MAAPASATRRWWTLRRFESWLERPMIALGFAWLALLVVEFTRGLGPILTAVGTIIWLIFVAEFIVRLLLAPDRLAFVRRNVLTMVALVLPAFRVVRVVRLVRLVRLTRVARGLRLIRVITALNRGMATVGRVTRRRGFGYVLLLTVLVAFAGAAGMYAFERSEGLRDYGTALWWTAMILTTMGSEYWPRTAEGRALALVLAVYAFTVFGYVTATLASLFLEQDRTAAQRQPVPAVVTQLAHEVAALRAEIARRDRAATDARDLPERR